MKATKAGPRKRAQIKDEVIVYYKDLYKNDDYEEEGSDQQEEELDTSPQKVKISNHSSFWKIYRDEIKKFRNTATWYPKNRKEHQKIKLNVIANLYG